MSDLSKQRCVVLDHGVFIEVALRLARDVGKVYYVDPCWEEAFPKIDHAVIGDGFDEIERVPEIWDVIERVDFAVFPDVCHAAMQLHLESLGLPVWGARRADQLELHKASFRAMQRQLGMEVPEYEVVIGLEHLRERLKTGAHEDEWIKVTPQYRGNRETFQVKKWPLTREILDAMGMDFNILQDHLRFVCEKNIDSKIEGGLDTYTVDGQHPKMAVQGYEAKDKCYFATVQSWEKIPEPIRCVNEFLWPDLKHRRCRQMLSTEVKVTEDGKSFLLEPTVRFPSPAGEEQMELYGNFSEIIAAGATGKLVEPVVTAQFACEAMVQHQGNKDRWRSLQVPKEIRQWVKLYNTTQVGDVLGIAPGSDIIGAVVGIGDTPTAALDHLKDNAAGLEGQPLNIHVEALAKILQEIQIAEDAGLAFTTKKMPEPEIVIEK